MTAHNYYLVNKETKKVHFMFKLDPYFMSKDGSPEAWLGGRLYFSHSDSALTLEELYALDYSESYMIPGTHSYQGYPVFEFLGQIDYASYKGYRLYQFRHLIQHYDDFAGNDLMEMNAFLATLFQQYIGPEEVVKWGAENFVDKYGVNELIMKNFTIEYDNNDDIHLHASLTDDIGWNGFTTGKNL